MTSRAQFDAAWSRWDANGDGQLQLSEVKTHSSEIAELIGDPMFEDPEVLFEFTVNYFDQGFGTPKGANGAIDKEELWALLQEAAAHG